MELLEVKSNIAKILYNPADNHLLPSDFLLLEDTNQKLIAQIINISTTENSNNNLADVRLILSIDKDDNLSYYNGYIPLKSAGVVYIHPDEIIELIKSSGENIYLGNLSNHNDCFVKVPMSCINDRVYIQSDRYDKIKIFIQNLAAELIAKQNKIVIIDFSGNYSAASNIPTLKITESFKLPLNIEAFDNIIEYDTKDCPIEDKAVIQSIVLELRDYIKTIDNKFLPFTLFKTVIDNEYSANPISGLMLLRNKLWQYAQDGIFAESKKHFEILSTILSNQNIVIIDASSIEEKWYKFTVQTIQNLINQRCYLVMSLNDIEADKKAIMSLYSNPNVIPIVSTTYDSKYRQLLKSICKNQILFKPSKVVNDEDVYNNFLNRINSGEFILYGESNLYIPLILELQSFNSTTHEKVSQNEIKKEVDKIFTGKKTIPTDTSNMDDIPRPMSFSNEEIQQVNSNEQKIDNDFSDDDLDFLDERDEEKPTADDIKAGSHAREEKKYDVFTPYGTENEAPKNVQGELVEEEEHPKVVAYSDKDLKNMTSEPVSEQDKTEVKAASSLNELDAIYLGEKVPDEDNKKNENKEYNKNINNVLDEIFLEDEDVLPEYNGENSEIQKQINEVEAGDISSVEDNAILDDILAEEDTLETVEPVDIQEKTTEIDEIQEQKNEPEEEIASVDEIIDDIQEKAENKQAEVKEDIDSILDDIDDNPSKAHSNPIIDNKINDKDKPRTPLPVYEADEPKENLKKICPFNPGDKVFHPKHGYGNVKEVIPFGNKILFCKVDFDTKGIRLLDPRVSGLEKV